MFDFLQKSSTKMSSHARQKRGPARKPDSLRGNAFLRAGTPGYLPASVIKNSAFVLVFFMREMSISIASIEGTPFMARRME